MSWTDVERKIALIDQSPAQSSKSNAKSLRQIVKVARSWGIDPEPFSDSGISNMREIIHEALRAVDVGDRDRLELLFRMAGTLSVTALRLWIRDNRDRVPYKLELAPYSHRYVLTVTPRQFELIKSGAFRSLDFVEVP